VSVSAALAALPALETFASLSGFVFFAGTSRITSAGGVPFGRRAGRIVISGGSVWKLRKFLAGAARHLLVNGDAAIAPHL
jgi:hypothetical protein